MNKNKIILSIITICLDSEKTIRDTLESIKNQENKNFEYIIIDGGSNDKTLSIINEYRKMVNILISEKDDGISSALNRGVTLASGKYILFVHSDDFLTDCLSTQRILDAAKSNKEILGFNINFLIKGKIIEKKPRGLNFYTNLKMPFYHPATVCKKDLFKKIGMFDVKYKIAMDYDFFLRAYRSKSNFHITSEIITTFRDSGISSKKDYKSLILRFNEEKEIHYKNKEKLIHSLLYRIWWLFYPIYIRAKHQEKRVRL